ncbi:hypothetical protein ACFV6G_22500, partial [Streptomyces lavendulae]
RRGRARGGGGARPGAARAPGGGGAGGGGRARAPPPPAISEADQLPLRRRPSLQAVNANGSESPDASAPRTVDLTAEDDTQTIPRLDSLERKLKDLEQQFG